MKDEVLIIKKIDELKNNLDFFKDKIMTGKINENLNLNYYIEELSVIKCLIEEGLDKKELDIERSG
jgi:hypothetical protein